MSKYKVITLCGSTKFKDKFLEIQKKLTLEGNIVLTVGLFGHSGDNEAWTEGTKEMLDDMHLAKIDMSDEIFVINVDGYIGESTKREIGYALYKGKSVTFLEPYSCKIEKLLENSAKPYYSCDINGNANIKCPYCGHEFILTDIKHTEYTFRCEKCEKIFSLKL